MNASPLPRWTLANALGLAVGFVAALQVGMLFEFGFDWQLHWKWSGEPVNQSALSYLGVFAGWLLAGLLLGSAQALVLRPHLPRIKHWILATVAGFAACAAIFDFPLIAFGFLGAIPGPVEPLIVTVGGSSFAGAAQYLLLRKRGINASKWLLLWIGGLVASVIPTWGLFMSLSALGIPLNWPVEIFLSGFVAAGVAALVSATALFAALPE